MTTGSRASRRLVALLGASLATAGSASAHPLDELAQASYVELASARVSVELNVTPGERVAKGYFASLDRDANGALSASERDAESAQILSDLRLSLDGKPLTPVLSRSEFPSDAVLKAGGGAIKLFAAADFSPLALGKHVLRYENRYEPIKSGYLVAVLVGKDGATVGAQSRDERQRSLELTFTMPGEKPVIPVLPALLIVALGVALAGFVLWRQARSGR